MSAPSRRPEIRRRRTRSEKITKLKKRLSAASTETDRTRITAKLHRLEFNSPRTAVAQEGLNRLRVRRVRSGFCFVRQVGPGRRLL